MGLWLFTSYRNYQRLGYSSGQGRYFLPYINIFIFSLLLMAGNAGGRVKVLDLIQKILIGIGIVGLGIVLVRPLFYIDNSLEMYLKASIPKVVQRYLTEQGYLPLKISEGYPARVLSQGYKEQSRSKLRNYYTLSWQDATLGGILDEAQRPTVLHVAVWARGDRILFEDAKLLVGIGDPRSGKISEIARREITLKPDIELYEVSFPLDPPIRQASLYIQLTNYRPEQGIFQTIYPLVRNPEVFGVFYRFEE
jgi:hypothetical protein